MTAEKPTRGPRNRTITIDGDERHRLLAQLVRQRPRRRRRLPLTGIALGDVFSWVKILPPAHVDLLLLDPPYNLSKTFNGRKFTRGSIEQYARWLDQILEALLPLLKPTATVYICGDWYSSPSIFSAASKHLQVRNRITWEREKGRGATTNWKNACEDIWFCTMSRHYTFNVAAVKTRRPVLAPYTDDQGRPKDWVRGEQGDYRDTHPSNLWTDITVPFWSMPENTVHPTQKSEKLMARLVLASTNPGDFIFDPFLGSGTTAVVARKLQRRCLGIERELEYCLLAAKRLEAARAGAPIQGYRDGVFLQRNAR